MTNSALPESATDCGFRRTAGLPDSGWSRRNFLGVLSALAAGTLAGCSQAASPQPAADVIDESHDEALGGVLRKRPFGDSTPVLTPYSLTAQAELSQDWLSVVNRNIDSTKDKLIAYSRADGEVEAVLLQDGSIRVVYHDPTQPGGWNEYVLDDGNNQPMVDVTDMVAGISDPTGSKSVHVGPPTLKICYLRSSNAGALFVAAEKSPPAAGSAPSFANPGTVPWNRSAGPLQIALNNDDSLLVTAMSPSSARGQTDAQLCFWTDALTPNGWIDPSDSQYTGPSWGQLSGFEYYLEAADEAFLAKMGNGPGWSAVVCRFGSFLPVTTLEWFVPATAYAPDSSAPGLRVWTYTWPNPGQRAGNGIYVGSPPNAPSGGQVLSIDFLTVLGSHFDPTALVRTTDPGNQSQSVYMLTANDVTSRKNWIPLATFDNSSAASDPALQLSTALSPAPNTETGSGGATSFLDIFAVYGDTLSVIRQAPTNNAVTDAQTPLYGPLLPLQPQVAAMTSQVGQSTGNELLLVGTDGTLQELVKDPVSDRWADNVIHLPADELLEVSTYRVEVSLTDQWNNPVSGQALQITASTPATALVDANATSEGSNVGTAVALSQNPATVTTGGDGQASFALVADGLSAPTLTIAAAPQSVTLTMNPSEPINTYMQGGTNTLNAQQPLSTGTLQNAKTNAVPAIPSTDPPTPAVPARPVVPAGATVAGSDVAGMNQAANWGANPPSSVRGSSTVVGRRDGTLPARLRRRRHGELSDAELRTVAGDINTWTHDALHSIKKGALGVTLVALDSSAVRTFDVTVDKVSGLLDNVLQVAVHGIEDAAHVVHSVLNKIGAAIKDAIDWLKAEVLSLLTDTAAVAHTYDWWLADFCTNTLASNLAAAKTQVTDWLKNEQAYVDGKFDDLISSFQSHPATFADLATGNLPAGAGGLARRQNHPRPRPRRQLPDRHPSLGSASSASSGPHGDWLLNKVKNAITGQLVVAQVDAIDSGIRTLKDTLTGAAASAMDAFQGAIQGFWQALAGTIKDPQNIPTMVVDWFLTQIKALIDDLFTVVAAIVDDLLTAFAALAEAIPAILTTPLSDIGLIGPLLKLVGLGNVQIGTLIHLLFAFPATLAYKIENKDWSSRPFADVPTSNPSGVGRRHTKVGDDYADDLRICAGAALGVWAFFDTINAAFAAGPGDTPMLLNAVDIAAPIIVTFLTVPSVAANKPYHSPPVGLDTSSAMNYFSWNLGALPALCAATNTYVDAKMKDDPAAPVWKSNAAWITSMLGLGAMITGLIGNATASPPVGVDYAVAILNSVANVIAPGTTDKMVDATGGLSAVIVSALTFFCGTGGAFVYGLDG